MNKRNSIQTTDYTLEQMVSIVQEAKKSHELSKDSATDAVSNVYLLYRICQIGEQKEWLSKAIEQQNANIKTYNDNINQMIRDIEKPDTTLENLSETLLAEEDKALDISRLKKMRQVNIENRAGGSSFNMIVRFVFEFIEQTQAAMVSRYSTVAEYLDQEYGNTKLHEFTKDMLIDCIKTAGGFEEVLRIMREQREDENPETDSRKFIAQKITDLAKTAGRTKTSMASFNATDVQTVDGYTLLLARVDDDTVHVIDFVTTNENEINKVMFNQASGSQEDDDPERSFIVRTLEIGETIREGQETQITYDGTQSGEKIKTTRSVMIRKAADGSPEIVVSCRSADASPVLIAKPKDQNFVAPDFPAYLMPDPRKRLEKLFKNTALRKFLKLKPDTAPLTAKNTAAKSPLLWKFEHTISDNDGHTRLEDQFFWTHVSSTTQRPLDVRSFNKDFECTVTKENIRQIYVDFLQPWQDSKSKKKDSYVCNLLVEKDRLELNCPNHDPVVISMDTGVTAIQKLNIRTKELHDFFAKLSKQTCSQYTLSADQDGLIRVSWEDSVGNYSYNLPTATNDGRLNNRLVSPVRV